MSAWRITDTGILLPDAIAGEWDRVAHNRYVAHIDMLGMTELSVRNPLYVVRTCWTSCR